MIHGKNAKEGSSMSASAFHEVCSQAVRYLGFFNPTDTETKLTTQKIADDWVSQCSQAPKIEACCLGERKTDSICNRWEIHYGD